ncbi:glycerophosphodiester phosphodiesterase [Hymenobacter sp.]|uniref:glycerophosphodiester phosphodiesterase n=1 Tax=Hymenobacter sp. TaxID=1898978 RepID=UPI00286D0BA9|nr:glycerophosphodiester phosphodiesterase [Hymenobacter sp.]
MRKTLFLLVPVVLALGWLGVSRWQLAALTLPAGAAQPLVVGHGGSGFFTPLNPFNPLPPSSMTSFRQALARGADGVEVDVQLSQDSVPTLYHDRELTSMTAGGTGCVSQHPAAELVQLRYRGGWPYDWFQHERLVTLDTLLRELAPKSPFPYLHLDLHEGEICAAPGQELAQSPALARQLARRLIDYRVPLARVLITSNYLSTLRYLRTLLPAVPLALEIVADFDSAFAQAQAAGIQTLVVKKEQITPERVRRMRAAGIRLVLFGGRSTSAIKHQLVHAPYAIETDHVARLLSLLDRPVQQP